MRTVSGIVTGRVGQTLIIRLESGTMTTWPDSSGLRVNSKVWVEFNHTEGKPRRVVPAKQEVCNDSPSDIIMPWPDIPEIEHPTVNVISAIRGEGALEQGCGSWEYWTDCEDAEACE